jgi:hypothetical protein
MQFGWDPGWVEPILGPMARASGGFRRWVVVFAALALLGVVAMAVARTGGPNQTQLILRLSDLPPGYLNVALQEEQGDETYCARLTDPEDTPPRLARFVRRFHPRGCISAYGSLYTVPGEEFAPPFVGTGVMALDSKRAADAGWAVVPVLLGRLLRDKPPRELPAPEQIGRATRLFHAKETPTRGSESGHTTSFLAWRSGNTIANVMVAAGSFAEGDRIAAVLARRQQVHIDKPTPYTGAERFDGDVPLDDPGLEVPVYWLGMNFKPGHGLPSNRLFDAFAPEPYSPTGESSIGTEEAPGSVLELRYFNFAINSWSAQTWPLFLEAPVSRVLTAWHCTETRTIALPNGGTATIYGGYRRNYKRCPDKAPTAFTAWAEIGGVHLVVNAPWGPNDIFHTPYDSFAGMEAIVRALQLRPKPAY